MIHFDGGSWVRFYFLSAVQLFLVLWSSALKISGTQWQVLIPQNSSSFGDGPFMIVIFVVMNAMFNDLMIALEYCCS